MHSRPLRLFLFAMCLPALLLAGCATTGAGINGCDWAKPIYVSQDDVLTDGTARQILTHDETGKAICGWGKYNQTKEAE